MARRRPPETEEGWYVLHECRTVDWEAWRQAPPAERERAIESGTALLERAEAVEDATEGDSATFAVVGHGADLMTVHLRPTLEGVEALSRSLERSALGSYTTLVDSYVSVTEVSGYLSPEYFTEDEEVDAGVARYIQSRLKPTIPDAPYVSFYPMDKRRDGEDNWYDLPFEERADHIESHGEIGKGYAGEVTQIVSGSIGLDDYEWGITLFSEDPVAIKDLLTEMRFDPSTSRFAEFGPFLVGRRLEPGALAAYLSGETLGDADASDGESETEPAGVREELREQGVYAGQPHGEDRHAVVMYSRADAETVADELAELRPHFEHYDTHERTAVYAPEVGDGAVAIASLWETAQAAETAAGFLADLPEVIEREAVEPDAWGTMGMFYTVKPDHRESFVEAFEGVLEQLEGMEGHRRTALLASRENPDELFIASHWDSREDAMTFFRSDAFAETVDWGRDILAERPRHLFLE